MGFIEYDYVVYLMFDDEATAKITTLKSLIDTNNLYTLEREWPPHVTVDLLNITNKKALIEKTKKLVNKINSFDIVFERISKFDNSTLYLEPNNKEEFKRIKALFAGGFEKYRAEGFDSQHRSYTPHVTLLINDNVSANEMLFNKHFKPFKATVDKICVYDIHKNLIYSQKLNELTKTEEPAEERI